MAELKEAPKADMGQIARIIADYQGQKWALIPLLQEIQRVFGYIPPEAIQPIARSLGLFPSQVQGIITFYVILLHFFLPLNQLEKQTQNRSYLLINRRGKDETLDSERWYTRYRPFTEPL